MVETTLLLVIQGALAEDLQVKEQVVELEHLVKDLLVVLGMELITVILAGVAVLVLLVLQEQLLAELVVLVFNHQ
jgi:hypothetical protein